MTGEDLVDYRFHNYFPEQCLDTVCQLCKQPIRHTGAHSGTTWVLITPGAPDPLNGHQYTWECWKHHTRRGGISVHIPLAAITQREIDEAIASITKPQEAAHEQDQDRERT